MLSVGILRQKALGDVKMKATELFQKLGAIQRSQGPAPIRSTSNEHMEEKRARVRKAFYEELRKVESTLDSVVLSAKELSVAIEKTIFEKINNKIIKKT
jgi:hypothetical protein